ncbi:MAG: siderophore-interacting protein [Archangium gephyra]|uniref:Siderophore-interacting protein n=1 Tax=Archangium gephyra TaxID=48 RepID=A0A2W5SWH7_9BACT|nr:MAG: siderophore-interacting protein [Archangium gephyra]
MASAKGLFSAALGRFFFTNATVTEVSELGRNLRRIDLTGPELANARFTPGDKIQVFVMGEDMRTYTPFNWRGESASLIGFVHGEGPGSRWVKTVKAGDAVQFFGPRGSLDVGGITGNVVVIGDETSLAVARAFSESKRVSVVLEAQQPEVTNEVCAKLGLSHADVTSRGDVDGMFDKLSAQLKAGATPYFTGRAATTQQLKQRLKAAGLSFGGKTKAYWADGKRGLD